MTVEAGEELLVERQTLLGNLKPKILEAVNRDHVWRTATLVGLSALFSLLVGTCISASLEPKGLSELRGSGAGHRTRSQGGSIEMWTLPALPDWPARPLGLQNFNSHTNVALCVTTVGEQHLEDIQMPQCIMDQASSSWAWFEQPRGQLVTFWHHRCLAASCRPPLPACSGLAANEIAGLNSSAPAGPTPACPGGFPPIINGSGLWADECREGDLFQQWDFNQTSGLFRNRATRTCLRAPAPVLWECSESDPAQRMQLGPMWKDEDTPASAAPDGPASWSIPQLSSGEKAIAESFYDVELSRQSDGSLGIEVQAFGLARVLKVDSQQVRDVGKGDVIVAVNGRPAISGRDVRALLKGKDRFLLRLRREHLSYGPKDPVDEAANADTIRPLEGVDDSKWDPLREYLEKNMPPGSAVVYVGDDRGLLFRWNQTATNGTIKPASEMKFVNAVLAMRLVELGYFGLDDPLRQWLPWWPTEVTDSRSRVTVRHCLAFTTGFYRATTAENQIPIQMDGRPYSWNQHNLGLHFGWREMHCKRVDTMTCARLVLEQTPHLAPPGTMWSYTTDHLRLLAAVMVAATGQSYDTLIRRHIFDRTTPPMRNTKMYPEYHFWNPGASSSSSPEDFQRLNEAYFNGRLVSRASQEIIESDSLHGVRVRWFIGNTRTGRPKGIGVFGLGVWRSHPALRADNPGWCGYSQPCSFAPSHFMSVTVLSRTWGKDAPQSCNWLHSRSCTFYYHIQDYGEDDSQGAFFRTQKASAQVEATATTILSEI